MSTFNANPDERLLARFNNSRFDKIAQVLEAYTGEIPKHNGKPVCLTWALKGQCGRTCKRRESHQQYSRATNDKIHQILTDVGVPDQQ